MADLVLDTHACVFAALSPRKLGRRARAAIRRVEAGKDVAWIPAVVAAELVMLTERGRTRYGLPQLSETIADVPGLSFLPLDLEQVDAFSALASIADPFDRLIVAAARVTGAKLISRDEAIAELGVVDVVWD